MPLESKEDEQVERVRAVLDELTDSEFLERNVGEAAYEFEERIVVRESPEEEGFSVSAHDGVLEVVLGEVHTYPKPRGTPAGALVR